jgi:hypothetical protein
MAHPTMAPTRNCSSPCSEEAAAAVTPTEHAAANLSVLRAAWSRELTGLLGEDLDAVRRCNQLLSHHEQRLTSDGAAR